MKEKDELREKIFEVFSKADVRTLVTEEEYRDVCKKTAKLEKELDAATKKIEDDKEYLRIVLMDFLEHLTMLSNYEEMTNREESKRYALK